MFIFIVRTWSLSCHYEIDYVDCVNKNLTDKIKILFMKSLIYEKIKFFFQVFRYNMYILKFYRPSTLTLLYLPCLSPLDRVLSFKMKVPSLY